MKEGHIHFTEQRDSAILSSPGTVFALASHSSRNYEEIIRMRKQGTFPSLFLKSEKWMLVTAYSRWLPWFHYVHHHCPWVHRLYYLSSTIFPFYRQERSPACWAGAKPGYESMGLGARDPPSLHCISEKSSVSSA